MDLAANIAAVLGGSTAFLVGLLGSIGFLWRKSQRVAQLRWKIEADLARLNVEKGPINVKLGLQELEDPITVSRAVELSKEPQIMALFGPTFYRGAIYELVEMWDEYSFWYTVLHLGDSPKEPLLDQEVLDDGGC